MTSGSFTFPPEEELVEFFGRPALQRAAADLFWVYEATDFRGVWLRFSFDGADRSVQTELRMKGAELATVVHEGATQMRIHDGRLHVAFAASPTRMNLVLALKPQILVRWSALRVYEN